ncbi:nucleotide sugar dehydrogenase [Pseudomonadales bacterium]|nr:nucleotide sugar dehydrogenase [Pseudomonadales bacterium]
MDEFRAANLDKKFIVVQGLGFVGTVMSLVIANSHKASYAVIGVDTRDPYSYWKIADLNDGTLPLASSDPLVNEYYSASKRKNNFLATADERAFELADVIVVDVNLDVEKLNDSHGVLTDFKVVMGPFENAIKTIGASCKEDALIIVETTVPPGTCSNIVAPILKRSLDERGLVTHKIKIGHSYERVTPGPNYVNSIKNFYRVYSGIDEVSADATKLFLESVISTEVYSLTKLQNTESTEMAKVLENSYRAMNISFVNEWSRFAEKAGVDLFEVVDAIRLRPTHANLMYPGIGVGGYCLTKDPLLASWASKSFGVRSGLDWSERAVEINDQMPEFCFNVLKEIQKTKGEMWRTIGLLGVAYGPGIGDTRFSPVEKFYSLLVEEMGAKITCHDYYLDFWVEKELFVECSLEKFLDQDHDLLVITTAHKNYTVNTDLKDALLKKDVLPIIFDTVGLLRDYDLPSQYKLNYNYFVLGVGVNKGSL